MIENQNKQTLQEESEKLRKLIQLDIARIDVLFERLKDNSNKYNKIQNILHGY